MMLWAITLTQFDAALQRGGPDHLHGAGARSATHVSFETATRGRSLGKMAMGLRVVSDDGGPERFRQALFRALAGFVEIWMFFGGPAVICSLISPNGKRIGDVFAGTVVISERGPKLPPPPVMPPALAWWASSLELSGLSPDQAELARQFLSRATQFDPAVRDQMAYRIAGDMRRPDLATTAAGRTAAVRAGRRARRAAPPRTRPAAPRRGPPPRRYPATPAVVSRCGSGQPPPAPPPPGGDRASCPPS